SPDRVQARELIWALQRHISQRFGRADATRRQFELGFLTNAHIAIREEARQFLERMLFHSLAEQSLRFEHDRAFVNGGIMKTVNPAFARLVPAPDPIRNVHAAIHSELDIGSEQPFDEKVGIHQFKGSSLWLESKRMHAAAVTAMKIGEEE